MPFDTVFKIVAQRFLTDTNKTNTQAVSPMRIKTRPFTIGINARCQFNCSGQKRPFRPSTDGFGRSDTRARLRRFFSLDLESNVVDTLYALAEKNFIEREVVAQAIKYLGVDPDMVQRQTGYFTVICPEEFVCRYRPLKELLSPILLVS